jgi:thioredoxin-dependent peroxiredoxin
MNTILSIVAASVLISTQHGFAKDAPKAASQAAALVDGPAPTFELKNQDGALFKLADRKDKGWTVLFFYPKAGTPGCTKQACAFRDSVKVIRGLNAEVYGISADTTEDQKKFHLEHKLTFDLLADAELTAISRFHVQKADAKRSERTTIILDPQLKVRQVLEDVDPALDAQNVAKILAELQKRAS